MLVKSFSNTFSTGTPNFSRSQKLENLFETTLVEAIPDFIHGLVAFSKTKKLDEGGFSQEYVTSLNRYLNRDPKGILAVPEYRDFYVEGADPIKRVDIAFVSSEQGASKVKLYTAEAKRLPTGTGKREKEYVYGSFRNGSPSGGIQRFKTGDHGYGLPKSGLLGYIEKNNFDYWHNAINQWITDKANELPEEWKEEEKLQLPEIDPTQNYSTSRSVAHRTSDTVDLFHLWIQIPSRKS
jgi:hypothetical protein